MAQMILPISNCDNAIITITLAAQRREDPARILRSLGGFSADPRRQLGHPPGDPAGDPARKRERPRHPLPRRIQFLRQGYLLISK